MEDLSTSEVQSNRPVMKIIVMSLYMQQKLNTFRSEFNTYLCRNTVPVVKPC